MRIIKTICEYLQLFFILSVLIISAVITTVYDKIKSLSEHSLFIFILLLPFVGCSQDGTESTYNSGLVYAQEKSTGTTISPVFAPTTAQIVIDEMYLLSKKQKIVELKKALDTKPDTITGQTLLNYKTGLEAEVENEKHGRRYSAQITFPEYRK